MAKVSMIRRDDIENPKFVMFSRRSRYTKARDVFKA
jgi:hypothetical protein